MQVPLSLVRVLTYGQGNILLCTVHDHASAHKLNSCAICAVHNVQVPLSLVRVLAYGQGNILICAVHDHASAHSPQVPRTAAPFIDTHIDYLSYVSTHTHCLQVPRTATPFIDTHFVYILCLHSHLLPTGSTHKYPFH